MHHTDPTKSSVLVVFVAGMYLLPWLLACFRSHRNTLAIFFLNLLLGWTVLGWVGALVWSATNSEKKS